MTDYLVIWKINVDEPSPMEAAKRAREFQLDKDSTATFFDVIDVRAKKSFEVDLLEGTEKEVHDPRNA